MNEGEILKTIAIYATPVLLGLVSFFLRSLFGRFDKLEEKVQQAIIKDERFEQRIIGIETRLMEMRHNIEEMQKQIWEVLTKKAKE